jgi:flagellar hook-length control protein FliK
MAQMVNRAGQSEMRIGMNTSAFGTVDVRTVVHAGDVGLVIGSEKGDLRGLMTNEMPAISNSLQQQNLRLNSVSFVQGFASSGNGNGSAGGNSQQQFLASRRGSSNSLLPEPVDDSSETTSASAYGSSRGLSILA